MPQQRVAARRRVAQSEPRDRLGVQPAVREITSRRFALRRALELPRKKRRRLAMQFHERGALLLFAPLLRRTVPRLRNGDAAFVRHRPHRLHEVALVHLHHELENVAARAAAKAVIDLLHRMHRERRRLFRMKRAQPGEVLAVLFQPHIFAHHADDVRLLFHAIGK